MKRAQRPPMGGTKKVTISLSAPDLQAVKRLAKRRHGNNLSAAFAALIEHATRLEAMDRVLEGLPPPSPEGLVRLEQELAAPLAPVPVRMRSKKPAA